MAIVRSLITLLLAAMVAESQPTIHYTLGMSDPKSHIFEVALSLSGLPSGDKTVDVRMPAWRTGRYVVLDFAGGVVDIGATDDAGKALACDKTDKETWRIVKGSAKNVTVRYRLYANEFNMRTRGLNDEHAFIDPASVFMYPVAYDRLPLTLSIQPFPRWHVTTGLEPVAGKENTFQAPRYEVFADCPIEVGTQKDHEFVVDGVKHVWMIFGEGPADMTALIDYTTKLIRTNKAMWGRLPYERFVFMLHVTPSAGGGTEHLNSIIMGTRPNTFRTAEGTRGFMGLVSHEYFHIWNVKQLRPAGITPYDFAKENYTQELWLAEGGTDFYGGVMLLRAGITTLDEHLKGIAGDIRENRQRPGNSVQSVADASYDAWIKYWRGTQQAYNMESDYYGEGSVVTWALDMEILKRTKGAHSLDDALRLMFERFPVGKKGYTIRDLQKTAEEVAGGSFAEFFDKFVTGTAPIPWEEYLALAGLEVKSTPDEKPSLGIRTYDAGGRARVYGVVGGSAAAAAGVDFNDEIVALDGYKIGNGDLSARIGEKKAGDKVTLTVFRDDKLRTIEVTLAAPTVPQYTVSRIATPTAEQKSIYERWLGVPWPAEGGGR